MKTRINQKRKIVTISLLMAAGLISPVMLLSQAQNDKPGGLFGGACFTNSSNGLMNRGIETVGGNINGQGFGATNGNITGQTFGTPLGSGLFVMLAASVGYATLKSRKNQNRKEN